MAEQALVSPATLRKLLDYDPATGLLYWRERGPELFTRDADRRTWNAKFSGKPAFTTARRSGYLASEIFNRPHVAHRVAWALFYGVWPEAEIDHINGRRDDNRIANLRDVSRTENNRNKQRSTRNRSGVTGVSVDTLTGRWRAQIGVGRRALFLGLYNSLEEALAARKEAEGRYGFHDNHGRDPPLGAQPA